MYSYFCFLSCNVDCALPRKSERIFLNIKYITQTVAKKAVRSTAMTSRSKYWYSGRSAPAVLKCGAPRCLITYSVQKMAVSMGDNGLSRNILEVLFAFSA